MAKAETQQPQVQSPLSRVYMDIPAEAHHAAKLAALQAGVSLKAWLEKLVLEAVTPAKKTKK